MTKKQKKTIKEEIERYFKDAVIHNEDCHIFVGEEGYCDCEWMERKVSEIVLEVVEEILQRFIEETKIEEKKLITGYIDLDATIENRERMGYNQAIQNIKQKQQQWLEENL